MQQRGNDLCLRDLMFQLQTIITERSPFALAFKNMAEVEDEKIRQAAIESHQASVVEMSLLEGVIFVGENGAPPTSREVVIYPRGHPMSANFDPMIYPLFFPRGDAGWHNQLVHNPERATLVRNYVTLSQFYNYRLSFRQYFCSLFYGKKLFQQYAVDAYVKIEGQCLAFITNNQNKLRSEQYDALHEHVNNIANERNIRPGRVVILPSSYVGSPRALKENFEDAMTIFKKYGKPDLFITFTCNPKWRETTESLYPGQTENDRPDLVTRLFKLKLNNLLNDIFKHGVLEIPDPVVNRELYDIIKTCKIHGPCGILNPNSPCIKDGVCSKNYPKELNANTVAVYNGYPQYRRRDDGLAINIKGNNVDNLDNVNHNEVNTFLDCRYVSAPEALWRLFEYPTSHMSHTIIRLKVHLPENQIVYFREGEEQVALDRAAQRDTHLTAWLDKEVEIRLLLLQAKGATSWADLRTGLLQDETEWQNTLSEAVLTRMSKQIRQLFSVILTFCKPDDPLQLWNTNKAFMMEDFIHRQVPFILAEQATLRQIEKIIYHSGKTLSDYNLPVIDEFIDFNLENLNDNV
ncbi:uncharacterized protein LOC136091089 [Hydra vulgaris]|uniref:Uncharacterized protein LOC136091089 n=1 Tax=Hydra vulgaris TaxID=6087 RepID=A0ABM4DI41_HYDVU